VAADRQAFGLTAQKPSEMIAGLDEVARRAAALEAREEAKRKGGGKLSANVALQVDDLGNRWKRRVNIGIAVTIALVLGSLALMVYLTVHQKLDPREGNADAHRMLTGLAGLASRPDFFKEGEKITAQSAKERLKEELEAAYSKILDQIERDRISRKEKGEKYREPDAGLAKDRDWYEKLRHLRDAWGQPFIFDVEGDTLKISAVGKKTPKATPPEPVTINLRKAQPAPEKSGQ